MSDRDDHIDREAARDVRRIHDQLLSEGKLSKAIAMEGRSIILAPVALAAAGLVGCFPKSLGTDDMATVMLSVPMLIGLVALVVYLMDRR